MYTVGRYAAGRRVTFCPRRVVRELEHRPGDWRVGGSTPDKGMYPVAGLQAPCRTPMWGGGRKRGGSQWVCLHLDVSLSPPPSHSLKIHGNRYPRVRVTTRETCSCTDRNQCPRCVSLKRKVPVHATGCPRGASRQYSLRCALSVPEEQEGTLPSHGAAAGCAPGPRRV
uniref:Uncharacterized protein n=1 Tax=Myotis myotis TaxID=51298 RepID=A0A7J7ZZN4_MYOMY|nr:hypothetical protein mMyoMyo1_010020 [Myotis myotis]